tara:strand:+ start:176 stop:433 length:258 start_codon:yes stop_codon:yes gene_type:complete
VAIKAESNPSAHGVDAGVVVVSVTTTGRPMTQWRMRLRTTQTAKPPKPSQNPLASRIDGGPLKNGTRDGAEDSVRAWNQRPLQLR